MLSTHRLYRSVAARSVSSLCAVAFAMLPFKKAQAVPDPLKIEFQPQGTQACAVAAPNAKFLVSVSGSGVDFTKTIWSHGNSQQELKLIAEDKITRLCFFKNPQVRLGISSGWASEFREENPSTLRAVAPSRTTECRFEKWISQIGGKVLPLSLLSISFQNGIPPAGTPLINAKGQIIGLILQPASSNTAYAIPAQAVHRVQQDIVAHGKLVRGWVGISLNASSQAPRITSVFANSPASLAGLQKNDILLRIQEYSTPRYPDAVNALFYTAPGDPVTFHYLRNGEKSATKVTPIRK